MSQDLKPSFLFIEQIRDAVADIDIYFDRKTIDSKRLVTGETVFYVKRGDGSFTVHMFSIFWLILGYNEAVTTYIKQYGSNLQMFSDACRTPEALNLYIETLSLNPEKLKIFEATEGFSNSRFDFLLYH